MGKESAAEALVAMHAYVPGDESLVETLLRITAVTVEAMGADMAGLTILDASGRPTTAIFTDETAPEIDQAQYDADSGPCLDAYRTRAVLRVDRTRDEDRWPAFAESAVAHGVNSSISLPLIVVGEGVGALNLYALTECRFNLASESAGTMFAAHAAAAVANGIAYWEKASLAEQLHEAMRSRATIEQAKGIIMGSSGCSPEAAFRLLREQSQAENIKLRDIAEQLVLRQQHRASAPGAPEAGSG